MNSIFKKYEFHEKNESICTYESIDVIQKVLSN